MPFYGADCPVAVVHRAPPEPDELVLEGTLVDIAGRVDAAGLRQAAVILVGRALGRASAVDVESHLYSASRAKDQGRDRCH